MGKDDQEDSVTTVTPPPFLVEPLKRLIGQAEQASRGISGQPFRGDFIAPSDPRIAAGLQGLGRTGRTIGSSGLGNDFLDLAQRTIRGDFLGIENNPTLQQNIGFTSDLLNEQRDAALNRSNQIFTPRGGINTRQAFLDAEVESDTANSIARFSNQAILDNDTRERALQQNAGELARQAIAALDFPSARQVEVGQGFQGIEQQKINNELAKFQDANTAPFRPILPIANILASFLGNSGGTTTQSGGGVSSNPVLGGLSGGLGGAASGAALGSAFPGVGTLLGAILGGVGGGALGTFS